MKKIITPRNTMIEHVALQLAAKWYEVGRGQGLKSKYKTAQGFAKANLERFIPNAVEILLKMLEPTSTATPEMREEIYEALLERHNNPELQSVLPNIDVNKVIELAGFREQSKIIEIMSGKSLNKDNVLEIPKATRY